MFKDEQDHHAIRQIIAAVDLTLRYEQTDVALLPSQYNPESGNQVLEEATKIYHEYKL